MFGNNSTKSFIINTKTQNNIKYFAAQDLIIKNNLKNTYYDSKEKLELIIENNKLYFSPLSSHMRINNTIYHLTYPTILIDNLLYIPVLPFKNIINTIEVPLEITAIHSNSIEFQTNI